jgi:hypothetical protein
VRIEALLPDPWRSFLQVFDAQLKGAVALRCLGGFVIKQPRSYMSIASIGSLGALTLPLPVSDDSSQ